MKAGRMFFHIPARAGRGRVSLSPVSPTRSIPFWTGFFLTLACSCLSIPDSVAETTPETDPGATSNVGALLDSLRSGDNMGANWDTLVESAGWDTLGSDIWIPDANLPNGRAPAWRRFRRGIRPHLGFNKVDGWLPGVGLSLQWMKRPGLRLDGAMLRSSGRGRYQGEIVASWQSDARSSAPYSFGSRTRMTGGSKETHVSPFDGRRRRGRTWAILGGYSERSRPFGSNRPVANAAQSAYLALDEQSYLDRIEVFGGARLQLSRTLRTEVVYLDRRDRPIANSRTPHLQTSPQSWKNAPSERQHIRGVAWMGEWARARGRGESHDGFWWKTTAWGGAFGGDREFYTTGLEARRSVPVPGSGALEFEAWASVVGGNATRQDLADLGGSSSLRGYPDRTAVGATSLLLRTNYGLGTDLLARTNVRGLRALHLQPVLFFDAGAVWGDKGWQSVSDLTLPQSQQWKFDLGFGVQRLINYPGLLRRVRVDFAWRLDRSQDRFRASLSVTR